jgi:hypothetical protein
MLADKQDAILLVEGEDPDGSTGEVHDAVDAGRAVGPDDVVVPDSQPRILVGDPAADASPGPVRRRRISALRRGGRDAR